MRSIPHRVVCLLGLDDGSFPRHIERDGDDLTARNQRVGDRDVRSEDRQLLLDALLAAQDHLVVTYSGRDERSNLHRPPAVPVGELLDVVDHTVRTPNGRARGAIVLKHPLQPFDPRNFERDALVPGQPWSFDSLHLAGARAALAPRHDAAPFLSGPLSPAVSNPIGLDQLERFLRHPVRAFLRERLTISLRSRTRDFDDAIPIDLNGLERWEIADRVLQARLAGPTSLPAWTPNGPVVHCRRDSWPMRNWTRSPRRSTSWSPWVRGPCPRSRWTRTWTCPMRSASSAPSPAYGVMSCTP